MPEIIIISILTILIVLLIPIIFLALNIHNKLFKNRFAPDPLVKYYTKEEFNLEYEPIEFSCDNDKLKGGLYSKGEYKKDYIIIFCHGMWSTIDAYTQDIAYLCENGFQVLGFNYTGTDTSEGKSIKGLGQSLKCLDSAVKYVKSRFSDRKIYVVGHSWGGFAACNIVHYHNDIHKVVALAPFISVKTLLNGMMSKLKLIVPFVYLIDRIKVGNYSNKSAVKGFKNYNGQVLVIHSKNDHMVNYECNTKRLENCNYSNVEFIINDNKFHNPNYSDNAIRIMLEYSSGLNGLSNEEAIEFKKSVDFHSMGELDNDVMNRIVEFLNK